MELFLGTFEHTIDSKNRLTLPSAWRKIFIDDKVIISISIDNCIEIRTTKSFNDFTNTLAQFGQQQASSRNILRTVFSNSAEVNIDSAGRVLVPNSLLSLANINKSVVLLGVGDKIEIWDCCMYTNERRINDVNNLCKELESLGVNGK
ncbi:MAG: division/cell wall cluster transcriptional repressor MraZ [Ureaplasma sp.]|nr:division/cell wall cluster transcriptional repressor MraZ [Ureaplasma sp.]